MTFRNSQLLSAMDIEEVDDIPFNFTDDILTGETITDADITCEVITGTDASPQTMVTGTHLVGTITNGVFTQGASGKVVLQRFTAQARNVSYAIRCVATLSSGRKLVAAGELPVVKLASPAAA